MAYDKNSDFVAVLNEITNGLDTAEVYWDTAVQELGEMDFSAEGDDTVELAELQERFENLWGDFNTFYLRVTGEES